MKKFKERTKASIFKPHKVSKDLSGYITYIYGAPKTGKTTLAV